MRPSPNLALDSLCPYVVVLWILCTGFLVPRSARADSEIRRHSVAAAGDILAAGEDPGPVYEARFTLGQPIAGSVASGALEVRLGFWHGGSFVTSSIPNDPSWDVFEDLPNDARKAFALHPGMPNPSQGVVTISFDVPTAEHGQLLIFDVLGGHLQTLLDRKLEPGRYRVLWEGRSPNGVNLPSGVYFFSLRTETFHATRRLILAR